MVRVHRVHQMGGKIWGVYRTFTFWYAFAGFA